MINHDAELQYDDFGPRSLAVQEHLKELSIDYDCIYLDDDGYYCLDEDAFLSE